MKRYLVAFTRTAEHELAYFLVDDWWSIGLPAANAKDARRKAWRSVHRHKRLRFLVREGWRIWTAGLMTEEWPSGIWRGPRIDERDLEHYDS